MTKIAFVSPHCVVDFTNGAATATLDALAFLQSLGFQCEAFCNTRLDAAEEVLVEEILAQRGMRYQVRNAEIGRYRGRMIFTAYGSYAMQDALTPGGRGEDEAKSEVGSQMSEEPLSPPRAPSSPLPAPRSVPVTLFNSASTRGAWINREEIAAFLTACSLFLKKNPPDLVWTYGGDPAALAVQGMAKQLGIPVLFALHNLSYFDVEPFRLADRVIVPSEYAKRHYRKTLGLECDVLPLVVDPGRVRSMEQGAGSNGPGAGSMEQESLAVPPAPRSPLPALCVTFVNPTPLKGVFVFARIAEVLSERRPDIRLLIVEGSKKVRHLPKLGIDLSGIKNLRIMPNTPDPRRFFAATKLLLMPSLMENAALVAIEAMFNGSPVLASTRGGLPETIGGSPQPSPLPEGAGGFLFDIPARYTPETRDVPTAEEVAPWVETIIRLWDDAAFYEQCSRAARERAQRWHPDRLAPLYRDFFGNIVRQHGPPLVPRDVAR